jgi:peptidoglycan/LPS O-acetylase OafA/YrhL
LATILTRSSGRDDRATDRLINTHGPSLHYLPSFDGLRGLFILAVVTYHAKLVPFHGSPLYVDWFFVGSGFLITTLLIDEWKKSDGINLRGFYTRRALRLFPAMYAMVVVFVLLMVVVQLFVPGLQERVDGWWVDALSTSFYSYNVFFAGLLTAGLLTHAWSLAVEEQFYLIWPPIMRHTLRKGNRRNDLYLIGGAVAFIVVFFFLRAHFQWIIDWSSGEIEWIDRDAPQWEGFVYRIAVTRPDMIVYGCLIAILAKSIPKEPPSWLLRTLAISAPICWGIFFFTIVFGGRGIEQVAGLELFGGPWYAVALLGLGPTTLDLYLRRESWYSRAATAKPLRYLGLRTYGIYIWHMLAIFPFLGMIDESHGARKIVLASIASVCGVLVGIASYRFIELPFLRMKDRRFGGTVHTMSDAAPAPGEPTPAELAVDLREAAPPGEGEGECEGEGEDASVVAASTEARGPQGLGS